SLYVRDQFASDSGSISSWSVQFTTAVAGGDYLATSGILSFAPGQTVQTIPVTVVGDVTIEPTENFFVNLSSPAFADFSDSQGLGFILTDYTVPFTDPTLTAGTTMIKAVHINELRTLITAAR